MEHGTSNKKIAAIVPAYNEELTVGTVVRTLVESGFFCEVIVVSDGSIDRTTEAAREAGASKIITSTQKLGKGLAMRQGALATNAPFIFFCDADLLGLRINHLQRLIEPVISGAVGMCVDLHDRGPFITWLMRHLPLIGGERVVSRALFLKIPEKLLRGYRVEIAMNKFVRARGLKITAVKLEGLHIRRKMQKVGFWRGLIAYIKMTFELVDALWHA